MNHTTTISPGKSLRDKGIFTRCSVNLRLVSVRYRVGYGALLLIVASAFPQSPTATRQLFANHSAKAQTYLQQKRPDLAIPELRLAADLDPRDVNTQANLGVLLFFQGKTEEAVLHLRAAIELQPSLPKIQGVLGIAELHSGDVERGRKDLEAAFPFLQDLKLKIQVGLALVGLYSDTNGLDEAAAMLAQLRKADPTNPEVLYASYRTYLDLSSESILALSLAAPDSAQMHQILAHEETQQGNATGAVTQYRQAIAIDPNLPGVHFELGELLHDSQDARVRLEAEHEYRAALAQNPDDEKSICRMAEIDLSAGNNQSSVQRYARAIELRPSDSDARLGMAKGLIEMDQLEKAQALLEEVVQMEPTNAAAHYRLGTLYRKIGRTEDAKREIDQFKKYKELKAKLRALYKELQIQPKDLDVEAGEEN